jgi:ankyrin repeat protein
MKYLIKYVIFVSSFISNLIFYDLNAAERLCRAFEGLALGRKKINPVLFVDKISKSEDQLLFAASTGNLVAVADLVERRKVDINCTNKQGSTPLYLASKFDHKDVVSFLLQNDADFTISSTEDSTFAFSPIHIASIMGFVRTVDVFLEAGVDVNYAQNGYTALHFAAYHNHEQLVQKLILARANTNATGGLNGVTPLGLVLERKDRGHVVSHLLRGGANPLDLYAASNINAIDETCRSLLHWVAGAGSSEGVKILVENGADPLIVDECGAIPVQLAADACCLEAVIILLVNVNITCGICHDFFNKDGARVVGFSRCGHLLHRRCAEQERLKIGNRRCCPNPECGISFQNLSGKYDPFEFVIQLIP